MNKQTLSAFILALTTMMGVSAHAANQSQTLIRYSNGLIQTLPAVTVDTYNIYTPGFKAPFEVKSAALLYDKRNPLPTLMSVGANYAFFAGGVMATVDENGGLWYKGKVAVQPGTLGGTYFLNKGTNEVIAIDSSGFYNSTGIIENSLRLAGGNFFIDQSGVLTTLKHMGMAPGNPAGMLTKMDRTGQNMNDAILAGGNYFEKVDGTIVTVSADGFYSAPVKTDARPKKIGGNYFIGTDDVLYTIGADGIVKKQMPVVGDMVTFGYSYMVADDGYFIFIDGKGNPHTELVRVSSTGIKSAVTKQITDTLDTHQNLISVQQ